MKAEIIELIEQLFQDHSIGMYPKNNSNRADTYHCPSCGAFKETNGYATSMEHISEVQHKPDCKLFKLYEYVILNNLNKDE